MRHHTFFPASIEKGASCIAGLWRQCSLTSLARPKVLPEHTALSNQCVPRFPQAADTVEKVRKTTTNDRRAQY
jgi:hypothetical protein